ncbi:DUF6519 domain-containing protein [Streptomyces sp. ODS28]|uniref:DUF6519 domain-containing protein n=1 Tax=Streptomyces sp. ODS28 TaxID=3136688 RepID=UPI0031E7A15B
MHGDFSRLTFAPARHYSAVLVQQGRVQLDADANEQSALVNHFLRRLAADLIGPYGGTDDAFKITTVGDKDLAIGTGRYYVAGIPCENDLAQAAYTGQSPHVQELPNRPYLVYLRVHERLVTHLEDPWLREVALGAHGPDTAARLRVVWQVLATQTVPGTQDPVPDGKTILAKWPEWQQTWRPTARLAARALTPPGDREPCPVDPDARYRGVENQLYRVEIHRDGGTKKAAYKWSRDNGSVIFPLVQGSGGTRVVLGTLGRDDARTLTPGDRVEPVDEGAPWRAEPHELSEVKEVLREECTIEVAPPIAVTDGEGAYLRRWDQQGPAQQIVEETWLDLEDGVQIRFGPGGDYRSGDYWLIPARVATGDVEWPHAGKEPEQRPPYGIDYHLAPLARVEADGSVEDLRSLIKPLTRA